MMNITETGVDFKVNIIISSTELSGRSYTAELIM
jgi:hypothetical protein